GGARVATGTAVGRVRRRGHARATAGLRARTAGTGALLARLTIAARVATRAAVRGVTAQVHARVAANGEARGAHHALLRAPGERQGHHGHEQDGKERRIRDAGAARLER